MKLMAALFGMVVLSGCAATTWSARVTKDEFTDKTSCKVVFGSDFGKEFVRASGGVHYYPFIEEVEGDVVFGVHNDYGTPVGDVQIRIDQNDAILISYTETPVYYEATKQDVDLSYLEGVEGIDQEKMKASIDNAMKNVSKMSSPFTATSGEKAKMIISQLKEGKKLKLRIIGFGTNSVASTTGEYELGQSLRTSLATCGI